MNLFIAADIYPTSECVGMGVGSQHQVHNNPIMLSLAIFSSKQLCKSLWIINLTLQTEVQRGLCLAQVHLAGEPRSQVCWLCTRLIFFSFLFWNNFIISIMGCIRFLCSSFHTRDCDQGHSQSKLTEIPQSIFAPSNILLTQAESCEGHMNNG